MNLKRNICCIILTIILFIFLQWLNRTSFKENLDNNNIVANNQNITTGDEDISNNYVELPYGLGYYGSGNMAQNGYFVDAGIRGGYYYSGGAPKDIKYIYNDRLYYYPFWYRYSKFV